MHIENYTMEHLAVDSDEHHILTDRGLAEDVASAASGAAHALAAGLAKLKTKKESAAWIGALAHTLRSARHEPRHREEAFATVE